MLSFAQLYLYRLTPLMMELRPARQTLYYVMKGRSALGLARAFREHVVNHREHVVLLSYSDT